MDPEPIPTATPSGDEDLAPRGPWSFLREALRGKLTGPTLELMAAWVALQVLPSTLWALHLSRAAGSSALPAYWGEHLSARDAWELAVNGGLVQDPLGTWVPLVTAGAFVWVLWAGWKVQARAIGLAPRLGPWVWGLTDALLVGVAPLALLVGLASAFLGMLGETGIQGLGWAALVGRPLAWLAAGSAFMLQWWLCRGGRLLHAQSGWRLGSWSSLGRHLGHSFMALWQAPVQWGSLVMGGTLLRTGLGFLVLWVAWRLGGATPWRVGSMALMQVLAAAAIAWLLAWLLRLAALFIRHDSKIRREVRALRAAAAGRAPEEV